MPTILKNTPSYTPPHTSGAYLPVTWVLGGLLFVRPDGYFEASQDAVHLVGADQKVHRSQAFITCQPLSPMGPEGPVLALHCTLRVKPFEVVSEFQSFKHVEVYPGNELQEAVSALEHQVCGVCVTWAMYIIHTLWCVVWWGGWGIKQGVVCVVIGRGVVQHNVSNITSVLTWCYVQHHPQQFLTIPLCTHTQQQQKKKTLWLYYTQPPPPTPGHTRTNPSPHQRPPLCTASRHLGAARGSTHPTPAAPL